MAKIILLILISILGLFIYQNVQHPHVRLNGVADRLSHPFDTRLRYRIAQVDPRFELSQEELLKLSKEATAMWENSLKQPLFVYDPEAKLEVKLVYDDRQHEFKLSQAEEQRLLTRQAEWQAKNTELAQLEQQLLNQQNFLSLKQQRIDQEVAAFQRDAQAIMDNQKDPMQQKHALQQRQHQLRQNMQQLGQDVNQFNLKIDDLNQKIQQMNLLRDQLELEVKQYQQRFQPRMFDKGVFNGKAIEVYQFNQIEDLRITIAHEFGHALGLEHHDDPEGLMYPELKAQKIENFELRVSDLELWQKR